MQLFLSFSSSFLFLTVINLSKSQILILSDFNDDTFSTTLDPRYQIYDGSGKQLDITKVSVINRCGSKDLVGGKNSSDYFVFGQASTTSFQNFTIANLSVNYPIFSVLLKVTLVYFGASGASMKGAINYGTQYQYVSTFNLKSATSDPAINCFSGEIFYSVQATLTIPNLPSNAAFSVSLTPTTLTGSFGFKYLNVSVVKCDSSCKTCLTSSGCSSCTANAIPNTFCDCPTGFYWTNCVTPCEPQCLPCPSACKTCNYTGCITCQTGLLLTTSQQCVSNCPDGTYQSGSDCLNCTGLCKTCYSSSTNCLTCVQGYYESAGSCTATCSSTQYASDGHCLSCSTVCNTCTSNSTQCTSCPVGQVLLGSSCINSCPSSTYVDTNNNCQNCDSNCGNCSQILTNCTSCASILPLLFNGTCVSTCPSEYYYSNGLNCLACDSSCVTCTGPLSTNCLTCSSSLYLYQSQCQSSCPSGTLIFQGECIIGCQGGYYLNGSQCLACDLTCLTCNGGSSSNCLSCPSPLFLSLNQCLSVCPSQTYLDPAVKACKSCDNSCLSCSGPLYSDCLTCTNNFYLSQGICLNACPKGTFQYEPSKTCIICDSSCLTCSGTENNQCISCSNTSYVLNQGTCTQMCPDGKYPNPQKSNLCEVCTYNCAKCSSLTTCMLCENNYYLTSDLKCYRTKNLNFTLNQSENPTSFQVIFTNYWDYIRLNFRDLISFSINPQGDVSISSFSILNSSSSNVTFLVNLKYTKSFSMSKFSLIFNLTMDYSKTNEEYHLIKTNETVALKNYSLCTDNQFYDTNLFQCVQKPQMSPTLSYTTDPTRVSLDFSYSFLQFVSNIGIYSQVTIERFNASDFTYKINSIAGFSDRFIIAISTNKSIVAGPKLLYTMNLPDDVIVSQNLIIFSNSSELTLFDYYPLSNSQKNAIDSAKSQTATTSVIATGAACANSAVASGTPMLLQGLMLTELIYLIKYIEIRYPPNVLPIFNSSSTLPTFFFFYSFDTAAIDKKVLPPIFTFYNVKPFFLDNNGEFICKNMAILVLVYLSTQLIENSKSTSLIVRGLKFLHRLFVWELVIFFQLLYWQKFVFYTFSNVTFSSSSQSGLVNFSIACVFIMVEFLFLLHIYLILNVITSIKIRMGLLKLNKSPNLPFVNVIESNNQIESGKDLSSGRQPEENFKTSEKQFFTTEKKSQSNNELDKSPSQFSLKRPKKDTKIILSRESKDINFRDSVKTNFDDLKSPSHLFSPPFSPSKFKKSAVLPNLNFDDSELHSAIPKIDADRPNQNYEEGFQGNKVKLWLMKLRIIQYFYFPSNDEVFLRQYEFMHDDLKSENIWQTHYVWFDYLRQTILSIFAVVFHFQPLPQICLINLVNISYIVFYILLNPYKSKILFFCCLISELITESALISSLGLAILDLNKEGDIEKRLLFGWIIVSANLALLYWLCFAGIMKIILMIYEKRKMKKIMSQLQDAKN